jgi:hypothetical protein
MLITPENYRSFPAVSNSDLTTFADKDKPERFKIDKQMAYDDGNLIDALITEPHRVDHYKRTVEGVNRIFTAEKWEMGREMKKAYYANPFCAGMSKICSFQKISYKPDFKIQYDGFEFELPAKCKWDLFAPGTDLGGDIKSTFAQTHKQFVEACHYFGYYRSRAWYMDIEGRTNDCLIGISKKNFKVFIIKIKKGDALYNLGKSQYQEIAFGYNIYFGDINKITKL